MIAASDVFARLRGILPARWFGDATPVLDAVLAGIAQGWAGQFALLEYARAQTRVASATDLFLDLVGQDFFGAALRRFRGEPDEAYRARLLRALRRERVTRSALSTAVSEAAGARPTIFEPARVTDTGAYGGPGVAYGFAYNAAGRWGSNSLPFQAFVDAVLPPPAAPVRQGPGYGDPPAAYGRPTVAYGASGYASPPAVAATIEDAIVGVLPLSATAWLRITNT